jgi:choline dehydrogenase-like flavoprotein
VTSSQACRILVQNSALDGQSKTATGVELVDGRQFYARKEVIISCGALHTPQILLLSGMFRLRTEKNSRLTRN